MTTLTFTQILRNKELYDLAKARAEARVTATVTSSKRPKWAFKVLAVVESLEGTKVEVFDDYTFAQRWTQAFGGGTVWPRDVVADYTSNSVTLKDGLTLTKAEIEPYQLELL